MKITKRSISYDFENVHLLEKSNKVSIIEQCILSKYVALSINIFEPKITYILLNYPFFVFGLNYVSNYIKAYLIVDIISRIFFCLSLCKILLFKGPHFVLMATRVSFTDRGTYPNDQALTYRDSVDPFVEMSPVSPVFHTEATVSIGLKNIVRVGTSIL